MYRGFDANDVFCLSYVDSNLPKRYTNPIYDHSRKYEGIEVYKESEAKSLACACRRYAVPTIQPKSDLPICWTLFCCKYPVRGISLEHCDLTSYRDRNGRVA